MARFEAISSDKKQLSEEASFKMHCTRVTKSNK